MKKRLKLEELMLETTRDCNLACKHCVRGPSEKVTMAPGIIEAAMSDIKSIGALSFTGGEPALHPQIIKRTLTEVQRHKIGVDSVYIATNGTVESLEFATTLMEWYAYCMKCGGEAEMFSLRISNTAFHDVHGKKKTALYDAFKFTYHDQPSGTYGKELLINDGRAKTLPKDGTYDFRTVENVLTYLECEDFGDCVEIGEAVVYINVYGDVMFGCDYSYQRQKREKIGNVLDKPLRHILIEYLKKAGKL